LGGKNILEGKETGKIYDGEGKIYPSWKIYVWKLMTNGRDRLWTCGIFETFRLLKYFGTSLRKEEF
jgi:hypothetical protein